jgi:hypothetical protein
MMQALAVRLDSFRFNPLGRLLDHLVPLLI